MAPPLLLVVVDAVVVLGVVAVVVVVLAVVVEGVVDGIVEVAVVDDFGVDDVLSLLQPTIAKTKASAKIDMAITVLIFIFSSF